MGWIVEKHTSTTTLVAPSGYLLVSGCTGGGGGAGGCGAAGGGGGGGGAGTTIRNHPFFATPGETLTLTIGGAGTGGPSGSSGADGGDTSIVGASDSIVLKASHGGQVGSGTTGGKGSSPSGSGLGSGASGGTSGNAGSSGSWNVNALGRHTYSPSFFSTLGAFSQGGGGGGLNANGGEGGYATPQYVRGGTGGADGGGGGGGGSCDFGVGGVGGNNGGNGANATGYGCGGGGGSGAGSGGNGSGGVLFIAYFKSEDSSGITTLLSRIVGTLAAGTHNPQSGDAYARLGAPIGASLSADIATKLATSGYTAPDNSAIAAIKTKTDNLPADTNTQLASLASSISTLLGRIIGTLAAGTHQPQGGDAFARLGAPFGASISVDIAAKLATSSYTAPDNSGIAAIKTKTDNLPADTNSLLTSTGIKVSSIANGAIAAATFAANALDAVWSVTSRTLTAISDSAGITTLLSRLGSALTINGGKVTVGTNDDKTGYALATTPPTAEQIRTEMDTNSAKLANLDATISSRLAAADYGDVDLSSVLTAIAALHDFDPATDIVARVTLVDTTTTLTNAPDVPTEAEIADAVRTELTPELAAVLAMETRMAEQVPTGPVIVTPAPVPHGKTMVWIVCYDQSGDPEEGVTITITCTKTTESGAYDNSPVVLVSDEDGLAMGEIPRGAGLAFSAKRGKNGNSVRFAGVDADTLALPPLLGSP